MTECLPDFPRYINQGEDGRWYGADDREGPWRPIPAPQSGLPWRTDGPAVPESREPASVAADARPLSPAAQAVRIDIAKIMQGLQLCCRVSHSLTDALPIRIETNEAGLEAAINNLAAAALRAVADQVFPEECPPYEAFLEWLRLHPNDSPPWDVRASKRAEILAIAAELEGTNA